MIRKPKGLGRSQDAAAMALVTALAVAGCDGGRKGSIWYSAMPNPLSRGYAVASTDSGHEGGRGTFAFEHPEWLVDFAWRAVHETAVTSQAIISAYYAEAPRRSYWSGCSSGGRQGLKEAQMFRFDFDGIIVGAPANNRVRLGATWIVASDTNRHLPDGTPICTYLDIAVYNGSGSDSEPANFTCQAGARGPRPGHGP